MGFYGYRGLGNQLSLSYRVLSAVSLASIFVDTAAQSLHNIVFPRFFERCGKVPASFSSPRLATQDHKRRRQCPTLPCRIKISQRAVGGLCLMATAASESELISHAQYVFHTFATSLVFSFDLQVFDRKETGSPSSSERIPSISLTNPLNVP